MAWWNRRFSRRDLRPPLSDDYYTVPFVLYTEDGGRGAEILLRSDGLAFYVETEWVEGTTFRPRTGDLIGPYKSAEEAEHAVATSSWFQRHKPPN